MSVILPTEPIPAIKTWEAFDLLIIGDKSIGKSGFLASIPNYLLLDPEDGMDSYPGYKIKLTNWQDHLDVLRLLSDAPKGKYAGVGLDTLNSSYDLCSIAVCKKLKVSHPSEVPHGGGWGRVTTEFTNWLTAMRLLGYHIVGTCHSTITEVKILARAYNRWIPAFVGGGPSSTYAGVLKKFKILGFMTFDEVTKPATRIADPKTGKMVVDVRVDATDVTVETRVIHFKPSNYWIAGDTSHMLPDKIILSDRWEEDWARFTEAWGTGQGHTLVEEEIQTTGHQVEGGERWVRKERKKEDHY